MCEKLADADMFVDASVSMHLWSFITSYYTYNKGNVCYNHD